MCADRDAGFRHIYGIDAYSNLISSFHACNRCASLRFSRCSCRHSVKQTLHHEVKPSRDRAEWLYSSSGHHSRQRVHCLVGNGCGGGFINAPA